MDNNVRLVYVAYQNVYALMEHRGYTPADGDEMVNPADFPKLELLWRQQPGKLWIVFEKDEEFVDVGFLGKIDKQQATNICQYVAEGGSRPKRRGPNRHTHVLIVISEATSLALPDLLNLRKPAYPRRDQQKQDRVEIFYVSKLQINPLLFSRQPKVIRLITDEEEKEELRMRLVSVTPNKDQTLAEILPMIYFERSLSVWYDAFVDDVFYFIRNDDTPYFRVVRPDPKIEEKDKDEKKKSE